MSSADVMLTAVYLMGLSAGWALGLMAWRPDRRRAVTTWTAVGVIAAAVVLGLSRGLP